MSDLAEIVWILLAITAHARHLLDHLPPTRTVVVIDAIHVTTELARPSLQHLAAATCPVTRCPLAQHPAVLDALLRRAKKDAARAPNKNAALRKLKGGKVLPR